MTYICCILLKQVYYNGKRANILNRYKQNVYIRLLSCYTLYLIETNKIQQ